MSLEDLDELAERLADKMRAQFVETTPRMLTVAQVAERLAASERSVRDLVASGKLPSYKIDGAGRRVAVEDLTAYLEDRRDA